MFKAGVDIGSRTVKVVITAAEGKKVVAWGITDTGPIPARTATDLFGQTLEEHQIDRGEVVSITGTGYGRSSIDWTDQTVTEISCQAAGCAALYPQLRTVIDIGGQDSKVIALSDGGRVRDFALNDRCAAGTGRFLEMLASIVDVGVEELAALAGRANEPIEMNSTCAVFAESEIVGLLAQGNRAADIARGVMEAIARRTKSLAGSLSYEPKVVFTGGVAKNRAMVEALEKHFACDILAPENPQLTGAFGAALLAGKAKSA